MEKLIICGGCKSTISNKEYMSCHECRQKYDLLCANLSPKRFKKLSAEVKLKWTCLECKSKQPKLDNTNTPVRATSQSQQTKVSSRIGVEVLDEDCNITFRKHRTDDVIIDDKLRDIWENLMRKEMEVMLHSTINRMISEQLKPINSQNSELHESMSYISEQLDNLKKENADLRKLLSTVSSDLRLLKEENKTLKEKLEVTISRVKLLEDESMRQQQWIRLQNIEITGIPENRDESTSDLVRRVVQHIGVSIEESDLEFAHRVQPRRTTSAERARPIVARLRHRSVKDKIIAAARKNRNITTRELGMGGESNRVFVNEHLTKENKMLLSSCKQRAKEVNFKYIWTKNCRIYARKNDVSPPIPISSASDLVKLF